MVDRPCLQSVVHCSSTYDARRHSARYDRVARFDTRRRTWKSPPFGDTAEILTATQLEKQSMQALGELFSKDYPEIMALARTRLAKEQTPVSTLTLVHELYLDMNHRSDLRFETRSQFLAYASRAMRSLLIDIARGRIAKKRAGQVLSLTCGAHVADGAGTPEQLVALDEALLRLAKLDERLVRIAEMRVILGMELADIATALDMSTPTIKRDWQRIKAFLQDVLGDVP